MGLGYKLDCANKNDMFFRCFLAPCTTARAHVGLENGHLAVLFRLGYETQQFNQVAVIRSCATRGESTDVEFTEASVLEQWPAADGRRTESREAPCKKVYCHCNSEVDNNRGRLYQSCGWAVRTTHMSKANT